MATAIVPVPQDAVPGVLERIITDVPLPRMHMHDGVASTAAEVMHSAARRAALVSGSLALPPGPLGMATVMPDLYLIWKIQRQMVADLFALHGRSADLTRTHMLYCLFRHAASHVVRDVAQMRWGLVPRWAKDPAIGARMINARGETLAEKSAYRKAFERHRCLIPADGFYEWQALAGGRKQPMRVTRSDGVPFAFAGLSERWLSAAGDVVDSCTIVTTAANALLRPLGERMPVIVPPGEYARWLD